MNILIVDDDKDITNVLIHIVEERGDTVRHAGSVHHALLLLEKYKPDVVLLDLRLGAGSPADVINKVRSLYGSSPRIVVMSALQKGKVEEVLRGNVKYNTFMKKPFDLSMLERNLSL